MRKLLVAARLTLATGLLFTGVWVLPQAAVADPPAAGSAVTVSGRDAFKDLKITVAQTRELINQTVKVSWTGGKETGPVGRFGANYLQIMQCWGDDRKNGPDREQCQFGGLETNSNLGAGNFTKTRSIGVKDGSDKTPPVKLGSPIVPFRSVTGKTTTTFREFYDASSTNEVPFGKIRPNGTGEYEFEVQTNTEAYGLGCGVVRADGPEKGKPRNCWLVVVPRGDTDVDGAVVSAGGQLESSPLSQSNWNNRIVVPLEFVPIGLSCPIGAVERNVIGNEFPAEAVARWLPALCGQGNLYSYNQIPDHVARSQLSAAENAKLSLITDPVPAAEQVEGQSIVYAPVTVSGLAIAFVMELNSGGEAAGQPESVWKDDGQMVSKINLTPKLVAKLITQSYGNTVQGPPAYLKGNYRKLTDDPEFLRINKHLANHARLMQALDAMVPSIDMDATTMLWSWINADPEARDFLDGVPDVEDGKVTMTVNKYYKKIALPQNTFPRLDTECAKVVIQELKAEYCPLTQRPAAADMHEAGRAIGRGDTLGRSPGGTQDLNNPGSVVYSKTDRQNTGERAMLAVVDTATAARYGLPVAALRNAAGEFVAPTDTSLLAAVKEMTPTDAPNVLRANPTTKAKDAYPLPNVAYAAIAPSTITKDAGRDYAKFLRFATTAGQQPGELPGQLPDGYVPLPDQMRKVAAAAATKIEREAGPAAPAADPQSESDGQQAAPPAAAAPAAPAPAAAPVAAPAAEPAPTSAVAAPVADVRNTPSLPVGWLLRYLLAGILIAGGLATGVGPLLLRLGVRGIGR